MSLMAKTIKVKKTSLLLFVSLSCIVLTQQRNTQQRESFNIPCDEIYTTELGNKTELNFSLPINGLSCNATAGLFYHCLTDYPDKQKSIEFCGPLIWMEREFCPSIYPVNSNIQPFKCDENKTEGCPKVHYMSYKYYKNPGCFKTIKDLNKKGSTEMLPVANTLHQDSSIPGYGIALIVLPIVIIVIVITFVFFKQRHALQDGGTFTEETNEKKPLRPKGQFRHQRAISATKYCLMKHKKVIITGKPGSGKQILIDDLKKEFQDLKCVCVNPDYPHLSLKENTACLFIIPHHWLIEHDGIESLRLEMSKQDQRSVVIVKATENFMQERKNYTREFKDCTINLSGKFELTIREKLEVIKLRCAADGVSDREFTIENQKKAAEYEIQSYGFFYLIKLLFERKAFDNPVKFFKDAEYEGSSSRKKDGVQLKQVINKKAITEATRHLKDHKMVVVTGKPGTGRRFVTETVKSNFQNMKAANIADDNPHFCLEDDTSYFIVIKDSWLTQHGGVESLRSEMGKLEDSSVVVVEATNNFIQKNGECMEEFKHCIINLSGEFKLTTAEKIYIIQQYCIRDEISDEEFTIENQQKVAEYECKHYGFLYLSFLLFNKKAFDDPLQFLEEEADKAHPPTS